MLAAHLLLQLSATCVSTRFPFPRLRLLSGDLFLDNLEVISTAFSGAIVVGLSEIAVTQSIPTYRSKSFQ